MKNIVIVVLFAAIVGVTVWKWDIIKGWFKPKSTVNTDTNQVKTPAPDISTECIDSVAYRYIFDVAVVQKQHKKGEPDRSIPSAVDVIKNIFDYSVAKKGTATDNGKWEGLKNGKISFVAKRNVSAILEGGFNAVGVKYEKVCLKIF